VPLVGCGETQQCSDLSFKLAALRSRSC
jgi:hypothetical protein